MATSAPVTSDGVPASLSSAGSTALIPELSSVYRFFVFILGETKFSGTHGALIPCM